MKKRIKKFEEKSFEQDYLDMMRNAQPVNQRQWVKTGDAFVKFSLYENHPTVARPYTTFEGQ